jgi:hypothetical protein
MARGSATLDSEIHHAARDRRLMICTDDPHVDPHFVPHFVPYFIPHHKKMRHMRCCGGPAAM